MTNFNYKAISRRVRFEAGFHTGMAIGLGVQVASHVTSLARSYKEKRNVVKQLVLDNPDFH